MNLMMINIYKISWNKHLDFQMTFVDRIRQYSVLFNVDNKDLKKKALVTVFIVSVWEDTIFNGMYSLLLQFWTSWFRSENLCVLVILMDFEYIKLEDLG